MADLDPHIAGELHKLRLRWEDFYWIGFEDREYYARHLRTREILRDGTSGGLTEKLVAHYGKQPGRRAAIGGDQHAITDRRVRSGGH
jgi:hypothetical protein